MRRWMMLTRGMRQSRRRIRSLRWILDKTLFFSDGESSSYARWDTERESYVSLGRGIPEVEISLALAHKTLTGEVSKGVLSVPIPEGVSTDLTAALLGGL